ncbi:metallophosphoesterase family protein [Stetteria hydrogenophila]
MKQRRVAPLLLLLALALLLPAASAMVNVPSRLEPLIVEPQYSRPVVVEAGSSFNVTVEGASSVDSLELVGFNYTASISFETVESGAGLVTVEARLPGDVPPGLYGLRAETDAGVAWMPRSVWVPGGSLECLTIMHVTDNHLGASDRGIPNTLKDTKYVMLAATLAEQAGVDLAFVTGDVVDVGSDVKSLRDAYAHLNQYPIPTFVIPGNHEWAQVPGRDAFMEKYYGLYINSREYWYRVVGPFIFIGLDSLGGGYLPDEQLDFLDRVLSEHPDKVAVIAFHHPIFNEPGEYSGPVDSWIGSVYSSWRAHEDSLRRLISIIRSHDNVRLVLSGHIHRDSDAVLDGRVYFITTTTANHGTPTYWGFKIVRICSNGSVSLVLPPGKRDLFSGRTSFNTMYIDSYEIASSDLTTVIWDLHASRLAELDLSNAVVLFYLNGSYPASEYRLYGNTSLVHGVEYYKYGDLHVFKVHVTVPTGDRAVLVMSNGEDETPPSASIALVTPRTPSPGSPVMVYVKASDEGWGVREVYLLVDKGNGWEKVGPLTSQGGYYTARIGPFKPGVVKVKAVAIDYAGLKGESEVVEIKVPAPQPVTTTPPSTTTTTQEETTTQPAVTETATTTATTTRTTTTTKTTAATTATPETTATPAAAATGESKVYAAAAIGVVIIALLFAAARSRR